MSEKEVQVGDDKRVGGHYEDEISFVELVLILWQHRWIAIGSGLSVVLLAVIYLVVANPVYRSEASVLPPLEEDIAELNAAQRLGLLGYDRERVFSEFLINARSTEQRRRFFKEKGLLPHFADDLDDVVEEEVFEEKFDEKLKIENSKKEVDSFIIISFECHDANETAAIVNEFIEFAADQTRLSLLANVNSDIQAEIQDLSAKIAGKRVLAEQSRADNIARLREALVIAQKLDIKKPLNYNREYVVGVAENDRVSINTAETPLYTRGTIALEAEIESIKNRGNNDPFINGLRGLQESVTRLKEIEIDPGKIRPIRVVQPAVVPYEKEEPKTFLILTVSVFIGGFTGLFAAFVWTFLGDVRKRIVKP